MSGSYSPAKKSKGKPFSKKKLALLNSRVPLPFASVALKLERKGNLFTVLLRPADWFGDSVEGYLWQGFKDFYVVGTFSALSNGIDYLVEGRMTKGIIRHLDDAELLFNITKRHPGE